MDLVEATSCVGGYFSRQKKASQNSNLVEAHTCQNGISSYRHIFLSKIPGSYRFMNKKESFISKSQTVDKSKTVDKSQTVDEPNQEPGILDLFIPQRMLLGVFLFLSS